MVHDVQLAYGEAQALDRVMYEEEVRREALSFEQQFHYGERFQLRADGIMRMRCTMRRCPVHFGEFTWCAETAHEAGREIIPSAQQRLLSCMLFSPSPLLMSH